MRKRTTVSILIILSFVLLLFAVRIKIDEERAIAHRDPETVLRTYFDAWAQNDWRTQVSCMEKKYPNAVHEPVEFLNVVEIQALSSSATERVYLVIFDIRVKAEGITMRDGRYEWTYYLSWNSERDEWLITNHGAG